MHQVLLQEVVGLVTMSALLSVDQHQQKAQAVKVATLQLRLTVQQIVVTVAKAGQQQLETAVTVVQESST
jgi:hypothetical protein